MIPTPVLPDYRVKSFQARHRPPQMDGDKLLGYQISFYCRNLTLGNC